MRGWYARCMSNERRGLWVVRGRDFMKKLLIAGAATMSPEALELAQRLGVVDAI